MPSPIQSRKRFFHSVRQLGRTGAGAALLAPIAAAGQAGGGVHPAFPPPPLAGSLPPGRIAAGLAICILLAALWHLSRKHRRALDRKRELEQTVRELRGKLRQQTQESMAARRLAAAVEESDQAIALVDDRGCLVYANRAAGDLIGFAVPENLGRQVAEFAPPDEVERLVPVIAEHRAATWSRRVRCRHRDGERRLVDLTVSPVPNGEEDGPHHYFAIIRDMGNELEIGERTLKARTLDAVARFSGGLAHEFNNLLQVILGYAGEMAESTELPGQRESLDQILGAGRRGAELTARLVAFSRQQPLRRETVAIDETIRACAQTIQQRLGLEIDLRLNLGGSQCSVSLDRVRLGQALCHLAGNAREEMPNGGTLTIATSQVECPEPLVTLIGTLPPGQYLKIEVSDTGNGLLPDEMAHLFEPIIGTNGRKAGGIFQSLGLSMVHGIVAQHDGGILVGSAPGEGTSYLLYLPCFPDGAGPAAAEPEQPADQANGRGRVVLLAEDEVAVRQVAARLLTKAGYEVIEAENGKTAVAQFETHRSRISLAMLDIVMPELNGAETAAQIRRLSPATPILFCSGYAKRQLPGGIELPEDIPLLGKPYDPQSLLDLVERLLAATPGATRPA